MQAFVHRIQWDSITMESSPIIIDDNDNDDDDDDDVYDEKINGTIDDNNDNHNNDNDNYDYDYIDHHSGYTEHNADGTIAERTWDIKSIIYLWLHVNLPIS